MKKFTIFVMCLLMIVSCNLAGCSKFSINYVKFYNETVATVNEEKITRFELLNSYESFGYEYYVSQAGMTEKEALNKTLDTLIDRKLLVEYAKGKPEYALTEYDINKMYQDVLDEMQDSFNSFLSTARDIYGIEQPKLADSETKQETAYLQKDYKYKKRAELVTGDFIKYKNDNEEKIEEYALGNKNKNYVTNFSSYTKNDIVTRLYASFIDNTYNNDYNEDNYDLIRNKAIELLAKNLISYEHYLRDENGNSYNTKTSDLIKRLIERVYSSKLESAYIANVEDYYLQEQSDLQKLSVSKLLTKFETLTETDYANYKNSTTDYYNYLKTIGTDADMIYYTPDNATGEFGYFLHVLLPLEEAVVTSINNEKDLFEAGYYDETALEGKLFEILNDKTHKSRDEETGLLNEEPIKILDILKEYENVDNVDEFIDFMFKYTSDTATLTADMPYVIGYAGETNYSGMVEEFTEEAVRLLKEDEIMTSADDYIITQYGIHLLCYVGDVKADYKYEDRANVNISLNHNANNNLYYDKVNEFTGRTYFDVLFDLVYPASEGEIYATDNGYTDFESNIIKGLKTEKTVTIWTTKLNSSLI